MTGAIEVDYSCGVLECERTPGLMEPVGAEVLAHFDGTYVAGLVMVLGELEMSLGHEHVKWLTDTLTDMLNDVARSADVFDAFPDQPKKVLENIYVTQRVPIAMSLDFTKPFAENIMSKLFSVLNENCGISLDEGSFYVCLWQVQRTA